MPLEGACVVATVWEVPVVAVVLGSVVVRIVKTPEVVAELEIMVVGPGEVVELEVGYPVLEGIER